MKQGYTDYLCHHGVLGMKWGVRRYQNYDGTRIGPAPRLPKPSMSSTPVKNGKPVRVDPRSLAAKSPSIRKDVRTQYKKPKQGLRNTVIGTTSGHYLRNQLNKDLPKNDADAKAQGWRKLSAKDSSMHQFHTEDGVPNSKWISPDGHREVVFTGKGENQHITTNPLDAGTYNFFDPKRHPIGHAVADVLPYVVLGNQADDPSTIASRLGTSAMKLAESAISDADVKYGEAIVNNLMTGVIPEEQKKRNG